MTDEINNFHESNQNNFRNELESPSKSDNFILNYKTNSNLYGISFQTKDECRIALSTIEMSKNNRIEILEIVDDQLKRVCVEDQEFPSTKLMWNPNLNSSSIIASSSDVMRLYKYNSDNKKLDLNLKLNNKKSKYCAPLTSFDWNRENNAILGTASIDTTCTIWDLNKTTIRTQLIAHDKEVYDIAFSHRDEQIFISSGADGSIRRFDLRSLDHSTILYESKDRSSISKIAWNPQNENLISCLVQDKNNLLVIDNRVAMHPIADLNSHTGVINSMAWAPHSDMHICTVSDDKNAFIWNINIMNSVSCEEPILSYCSPGEISNVSWSNVQYDWVGIVFGSNLQLLKV